MPTGKAFLVLVCAALTLSGCATSSWHGIGSAKLSADERTLVEKDCPRQRPWEEPVYTNMVGYRHPVKFTLKRSLAGRTAINNTDVGVCGSIRRRASLGDFG
ncbi:hypothetical protein ABZ917_05190 [Nonomuraea wenchangensis]